MKVISIDIGIINFAFTFWDCDELKDFDKIDITTFIKENENISISEFLPSLTISGSQTSTETSNIVDQSGSPSANTKRNGSIIEPDSSGKFNINFNIFKSDSSQMIFDKVVLPDWYFIKSF